MEEIAIEFEKNKTELQKCIDSPYYYMTTYYTVNGKVFTSIYSEKEFNEIVKSYNKFPQYKIK